MLIALHSARELLLAMFGAATPDGEGGGVALPFRDRRASAADDGEGGGAVGSLQTALRACVGSEAVMFMACCRQEACDDEPGGLEHHAKHDRPPPLLPDERARGDGAEGRLPPRDPPSSRPTTGEEAALLQRDDGR